MVHVEEALPVLFRRFLAVEGEGGRALSDAKASLEFPRDLVGGVVPSFPKAMPVVVVVTLGLPNPGRNSDEL